ncbi:6468_t:CDS:2, partial [Paraglomus occultum]
MSFKAAGKRFLSTVKETNGGTEIDFTGVGKAIGMGALTFMAVAKYLEKKRKAEELLPAILKKKKWNINGAIRTFDTDSVYYVDPANNEENQRFLASIKNRH